MSDKSDHQHVHHEKAAQELLRQLMWAVVTPGQGSWPALQALTPHQTYVLLADESMLATFAEAAATWDQMEEGPFETAMRVAGARAAEAEGVAGHMADQLAAKQLPVSQTRAALPGLRAQAPYEWAEAFGRGKVTDPAV